MEERTVTRLCECVFDITCMAQHLVEQRQIVAEDSRELFSSILSWAREFEATHTHDWDDPQYGDYIDAIDDFAEEKLRREYGAEQGR